MTVELLGSSRDTKSKVFPKRGRKEKLGGTWRRLSVVKGMLRNEFFGKYRMDKAVKRLYMIFRWQTSMALLKVILKGLKNSEKDKYYI